MYEVSEDARLDTEFRRSVKGTSQFGDALVLNGSITAAADGTASRKKELLIVLCFVPAGSSDFQRLLPVTVARDGAEFQMSAVDDVITLEYNDRIVLMYTPSVAGLIGRVEGAGEYVRNTAIVRIIDNDSKFSLYKQLYYTDE